MPVAIFGDRSCGKTVFLSLLYESQVRYTNDIKNVGPGEFRFTTDPSFEKILGDIRTDLMSGQWADSTLKGNLSKYKFKYGYKKMLSLGNKSSSKFDIMDFTVYDIAGEDLDILRSLEQYRESIASGTYKGEFNFDTLSESFRELLKCNVLVFLVDLSRVNAEARTERFKEMRNYDVFMATLISAVSKYKSEVFRTSPDKAKIYPVFILTKFDLLDNEIKKQNNWPMTFAELETEKRGLFAGLSSKKGFSKEDYAKAILAKYYGDTMALAKGGVLANVSFDKSAFFFSEIHTEQNENGEIIPRLVTIKGKPELDYSDKEYRGFIDRFREIADKMPDEVKDEQEFEGNK
ncbi:MAG: hypothetical protein A4E32_01172 [Methanomassiliicoccales archaeon PtaU1.Bin124]|nr:MAG: hypothetical protein A4E32_01172 [Methanomassiliicoccales archaeon PtaU1.Bin124]